MKAKIKFLIILIPLAVMVILFGLYWPENNTSGEIEGVQQEINQEQKNLKVVVFDVGQGDAIFIETPEEKQILIDGGEGQEVLEKLKEQMQFNDRYIDLVILTHPHSDHVSGLVQVLKRYEVGEVWLTGVVHTLGQYLEFLNLIKEKEIPTRLIFACGKLQAEGCTDEIQIETGVVFKVLSPLENLREQKVANLNNSSIVLKLTFGNNTWMLTGDLEEDQEELILENFEAEELQAQVLKVGHHGSSTSSGENWLETVTPEQAIISVGVNNSFGHPSLRVIRRLERYNVEVWRTDEMGDVKTIGNGEEIEIKTEK